MMLPKFNELKEEGEFTLNVEEDILKNLCEEDKEEMIEEKFSSKHRADWRKDKESKILDLLKKGKSLNELHSNHPITLGLDKNNEITINDGFTRIKVAHRLGIKKIRVILAISS